MLRPRNIPEDIQQDIKIGKILSIQGLIVVIVAIILSTILSFIIIPMPVLRVFIVLGTGFFTTLIMAAEVPRYLKRLRRYRCDSKKITDIEQLNNIKEYGAIIKNKNDSEAVYIEYSVDPWEAAPHAAKEKAAKDFAQRIFLAISMGTEITVFSTCASEKSNILERRLEGLENLKDGLREIESERIEHHYKLSKHASKVDYTIRILRKTDDQAEDEIDEIQEAIVFDGPCIGPGSIKEKIRTHLNPDSNLKRGGIDFAKH